MKKGKRRRISWKNRVPYATSRWAKTAGNVMPARFSPDEAKSPEACLPCHVDNHPQYESYYNSKHGAIYSAEGLTGRSPTCATCHMSNGNHKVLTSWGFFGVRKEEPDKEHAKCQKGVIDYLTKLGPILAPNSHRATLDEWQDLRNEMLDICSDCHARLFCRAELDKCDKVLKKANCIANDMGAALLEQANI